MSLFYKALANVFSPLPLSLLQMGYTLMPEPTNVARRMEHTGCFKPTVGLTLAGLQAL